MIRIFPCLILVFFYLNPSHSCNGYSASTGCPGREISSDVFTSRTVKYDIKREKITLTALDSLDRQDSLSRWRVGLGIYGSRPTNEFKNYISGFSIRYKTKVTWRLDVIVPFSNFLKSTRSDYDTTAFIAVPSVTAYLKPFEFKLSLITMSVNAPGTEDDWFFIFPIPSLRFQLGEDKFYMTIDIFRVDLESMTNIEQAIIGIGTSSADVGTRFWAGLGYTVPFLFKNRILAFYSKFRYSVSANLGLSLNVNFYHTEGILLYAGNTEGILLYAGVDLSL